VRWWLFAATVSEVKCLINQRTLPVAGMLHGCSEISRECAESALPTPSAVYSS
jgi:hypothetical protein